MEPITLQEYAAECKAVAKAIVEECEGNEDDFHDRLHEEIDSHQWIIYTYYNLQVLTHSRNDGAYFDNFGPLTADGFSDAMVKMAFAAFYQDVSEELSEALTEYEEAHPED